MLQITALVGGLVAVAHAAAVQSIPELSLRASPQAALNCGAYPAKGPSDRTRYTAPDGKGWDINCHHEWGSSTGWTYVGVLPTFEACIAGCSAGQPRKDCNYVAYDDNGHCHQTDLVPWAHALTPYDPFSYSGAFLAFVPQPPINCKDGSSNGTIFTPDGSNQKYQILCNYQYNGDTLGASKRAETFEQCVGFCDATTGCVDVVYSDAKYCWLKKSKTNGYYSPNWWSAVKVDANAPAGPITNPPSPDSINCVDGSADGTVFTAPSGAQYDIGCNFQYDGQTLGKSTYTETFEVCADLCDGTPGCVEGIWSSAKYCWLKSSITGNGYKSAGWYSAVKKQTPP